MAESVGEERKDWELKKESELRLEVDENQQVVIRVSEGAPSGRGEVKVYYVVALFKLTGTRCIAAVPLTSHVGVGQARLV